MLRVSAALRPRFPLWRSACAIALTKAGPERRIGVCREYYLVRYYIPAAQRDGVKIVRIPFHGAQGEAPRVAIVSPAMAPREIAEIRREYPVVLATFKNVIVVSGPEAGVQPASQHIPKDPGGLP